MTKPENEGQSIDSRPDWLKNVQAEGTKPGELVVDGKPYQFTLVRTGLAPLPYTVGFPNESALFISVDVPEERRPLIMTHEVREKTTFAELPEAERCKAALEAELKDAKDTLGDGFRQYATDRRDFFNALVALYEQQEQRQAVTEGFRIAIQTSRDYLKGLNSK
jgi:hypothetical protein